MAGGSASDMARPIIQPCRSALQKAWALGRKTGGEDPRIRPMVADAADYSTFETFRTAHRGRLEVRETFAIWDEQIMRVAEREGRRLGFRTDGASAYWDVFLAKVVVPLKNAFWIGWESQVHLDQLYAAARKRAIISGTLNSAENRVFPATQVAARVQKPEVEEPGDDAFLMSITESPESPSGTVRTPGVTVLAASRLLTRVEKPEVEELGDEVFLMSVTAPSPGADAKKPDASVLEARKLLDRVHKPDVDEAGDDGFLLSVTEDGAKDGKEKLAPGVLAASKLVATPAPPSPLDITDVDLWDTDEASPPDVAARPTPIAAQPAAQPAAINDDDLIDLYET